MNDPAHNNATNTKAPFPDEYDELSHFIYHYMNNSPGMYAKFLQSTEICNQTPQIINDRMTVDIIKEHLHANHQSDLIAVPTVNSEDDTCRFVMIDIRECEDDSGDSSPVASDSSKYFFDLRDQAIHVFYMLRLNGIEPILCESPGMERYQIWVVLEKPMPASQMTRFGDAVLECCRHRMPTSNYYLYCLQQCKFDETTSCQDIIAKDTRINVYPSSQQLHSHMKNDFVPLPCLIENSFDYMENGYSDAQGEGNRMFMGGLSVSDNSYELNLNNPSRFDSEQFVYDPIMTPMEFDQVQFTGSEKPIVKVLSRLKGVQPCGNGYKACCTAHTDFIRSLLVSEDEEGNVQLHCSKGCSLEHILRTLDPSTKDLLLNVDDHGETQMRTARYFSTGICSGEARAISKYRAYRSHTTHDQIEELADFLEVSPESLEDLEVAYDQFEKGCYFPTHGGYEKWRGVQSCRNLSQAVKEATPEKYNGDREPGLIVPRSFDETRSEIIIANGAINTAVGLTLGWNVVGRVQGEACVEAATHLLKSASGEIRIMEDYCPSMDQEHSGTIKSDSVIVDEGMLSEIVQRSDMAFHEVSPHSSTHVESFIKSFAQSLQKGVAARVSIIDVPAEFKAIRRAAYCKSQSR